MAGLASLLLSAAILPWAVHGSAVTPVSTNCTEATSKDASWVIRNFTIDTQTKFDYGPGTAGKVSFSIQNTVNGYSFNCLQGDGPTGRTPNHYLVDGKVWYSCNIFCNGARDTGPLREDPALATSFHFNMSTKALTISQTWGCGSSSLTNYTGTGTSVISNLACSPVSGGRPDEVACAPVDLTVKASSVSLAVTNTTIDEETNLDPDNDGAPYENPFLPKAPPKPNVLPSTPGCSKKSQSPTFSVTKFTFSGGGITFFLKNSALDYTQRCNIIAISQAVDDKLQKPSWWNCTRFDSMHSNYPSEQVYTTILYGGSKNILGVNQTWYCDDEDSSKPTVYSVYGEVNFPIKCRESRFCSPATEYSEQPELGIERFCHANNLTITPSKADSYRVTREQAFEDFRPHGYNCSDKSLQPPSAHAWDISSFSLNRHYTPADPKNNITASYEDILEFWYNNTATDNDWPRNTGWRQCLYISDDGTKEFDGTTQLSCMMSFEPFRLGFKFDRKSSTLSLSQAWACDGVDSQHTNYFNAIGGSNVSLACTTTGNNTKCASDHRVVVPMTNITSNLNANGMSPYVSAPFRV